MTDDVTFISIIVTSLTGHRDVMNLKITKIHIFSKIDSRSFDFVNCKEQLWVHSLPSCQPKPNTQWRPNLSEQLNSAFIFKNMCHF